MSVKPTNLGHTRPLRLAEDTAGVDDGTGSSTDYPTGSTTGGAPSEKDQWKQPVVAASTGNVDISALDDGDTLDGVTLAAGDRVLLKDETTTSDNGIYVVGAAAGDTVRADDFDDEDESVGALVYVIGGTINGGTIWRNTNTTPPGDGDPITFVWYDGLSSLQTISPAQLVANTDNWSPAGLDTAKVIRVSTDASRNLTGIVAPAVSRALILENVGAQNLVLKHDVTSTAANRLYCPNDTDLTVQKDSAAWLAYDLTSSRWRVVAMAGSSASGSITVSGYTMSTARLLGRTTAGTGAVEEISAGTGLTLSSGTLSATGGGTTSGQFIVGFDAGNATLTSGGAREILAPFSGTLTSYTILGDTTGTATFAVSKSTYAGFSGSLTSIVAAAPPTVSGAEKAQSSSLTGWTTAVTAGDVLRVTLSSVSGFHRISLTLAYSRP